jgi:septum formation protein
MTPLLLASQSPRRRELLLKAGLKFDVVSVKVSEIPDKNLNVNEQIIDIARRKARSAYQLTKTTHQNDFIILAADTEVVYSGNLLGKPLDPEDAFRLLKLLSGKLHEVKTAVCLIDSRTEKEMIHIETTKIQFKNLTDEEIRSYVQTGEPMDKAGSYAAQGFGMNWISSLRGSYTNVVGLPMCELLQDLEDDFGVAPNWTTR